MEVAGIIAEYNPLHNGHLHHLQCAKDATGCKYCIVVMSGDFVQRGEPAIADKMTRAQWALEAGADLVLELPAVFATGSAERFAYGGVKVLNATGVCTALCFGSEIADMETLSQTAQLLQMPPSGFSSALSEQLALGKSFPKARYDALEACGVSSDLLAVLRTSNSILAMEYIRFLKQLAPQIRPVAISRQGAGHDAPGLSSLFPSASAIRAGITEGDQEVYSAVPMYVAGRFSIGKIPPVGFAEAAPLIRYALLQLDKDGLKSLPDVQEGLENVLYRAVRQCESIDELFALIKSKRYTMARCKRIAISALLGINRTLAALSMQKEEPLYLRVLGFRHEARPLVSAIARQGTAPLLMRRADLAACSPISQQLLQTDRNAHDIYRLLCPGQGVARDFAIPPFIR